MPPAGFMVFSLKKADDFQRIVPPDGFIGPRLKNTKKIKFY